MTDLPIFNPTGTWMDRIDPGLIMRFWEKKGCPGRLVLQRPWGITSESQLTPFGVLSFTSDPNLSEDVHAHYESEMTRKQLGLPPRAL